MLIRTNREWFAIRHFLELCVQLEIITWGEAIHIKGNLGFVRVR